MTLETDVLAAFYEALSTEVDGEWPTVAQNRVFMPRDWPTGDSEIPILKIQIFDETKQSKGNNGISFDVTLTVGLIGEVMNKGEADDAGAGKVLTALGIFKRQIELAVINYPALFGGLGQIGLIQQLDRVETKMAVTSDGNVHRGEVSMTFDFTYYQGIEDFRQPTTYDAEAFHIFADLINVADPTGIYVPPMDYDPTAPPRTEGPDGRVEVEAEVDTSGGA